MTPEPERGTGRFASGARRELAWAAPVALAAALPLAVVLARGGTLAWGDTAALFAPVRPLVVAALRAFRAPLWNPFEAMGIPLHAQLIHGALHPVSWLTALLAPGGGMDALLVANVVLAGLGAGALARTLGASRAGAAVAGCGYALSGYVLGMSAVLTYQTAAATAPWVVAALVAAAGGGAARVALASLAVGAMHLSGEPQWTIVAVVGGLVLTAERRGARGLGPALAAVGLGTCIGAAQLAPAWGFLHETERAAGLSAGDRVQWALSPWRLPELVAPGLFGSAGDLRAPVYLWLGGATQSRLLRPFVPSVFVGAPLLCLAALGVRTGRTGRTLAVLAAIALWLAFGYHAGAAQLLSSAPVWGSFRYAEKLVGPLTLLLAVLAGLGVERLARELDEGLARKAAAVALTCAVAALLLRWLEPPAPGAPPATVALARAALAAGLLHAAAGLGAIAVLAAAARRSARLRAPAPALAAAVVVAAGYASAGFALHSGVRGVEDAAPLATIRAEGPVTRVATPLADPPYPNPLGLDPADADVAARSRMGVAPFTIGSRIDQVDVYTGLTPRRVIRFVERMGPDVWTALRRFGLTHVVLKAPADEPSAAVARAAVDGGALSLSSEPWRFSVWSVPHRAWARFVSRAVPVADEQQALEALAGYELAGMGTAVVEGPPPEGTAPGAVLSAVREPERIRIDAEATGPAFLVVCDSYAPGWRAEIDGRPAPIYRTDYLVRGVPFPPGRHVLEMSYEPPEARLGFVLAAAGLLGMAALGAFGLRRGRGRRAAGSGEAAANPERG